MNDPCVVNESLLLARLREICLTLPEVRETVKWGHPTFEAGKKIFAVLDRYQGRTCIAFRAQPEKLPMVLADERFYEAPYGARHGWVCMHADGRIDWAEVEGLLQESYRQVALKRMLAALDDAIEAPGPDKRSPGKRRKTGPIAQDIAEKSGAGASDLRDQISPPAQRRQEKRSRNPG